MVLKSTVLKQNGKTPFMLCRWFFSLFGIQIPGLVVHLVKAYINNVKERIVQKDGSYYLGAQQVHALADFYVCVTPHHVPFCTIHRLRKAYSLPYLVLLIIAYGDFHKIDQGWIGSKSFQEYQIARNRIKYFDLFLLSRENSLPRFACNRFNFHQLVVSVGKIYQLIIEKNGKCNAVSIPYAFGPFPIPGAGVSVGRIFYPAVESPRVVTGGLLTKFFQVSSSKGINLEIKSSESQKDLVVKKTFEDSLSVSCVEKVLELMCPQLKRFCLFRCCGGTKIRAWVDGSQRLPSHSPSVLVYLSTLILSSLHSMSISEDLMQLHQVVWLGIYSIEMTAHEPISIVLTNYENKYDQTIVPRILLGNNGYHNFCDFQFGNQDATMSYGLVLLVEDLWIIPAVLISNIRFKQLSSL